MTSTKINIQENTTDKTLWRKLKSVNTESDLDKRGGGKGFSEEVMFKLDSTWQKKKNWNKSTLGSPMASSYPETDMR